MLHWGASGNRIGAVLATLGVHDYNPLRRDRRVRLDGLRTALGNSLPANARAKIARRLNAFLTTFE
jgi:transposase